MDRLDVYLDIAQRLQNVFETRNANMDTDNKGFGVQGIHMPCSCFSDNDWEKALEKLLQELKISIHVIRSEDPSIILRTHELSSELTGGCFYPEVLVLAITNILWKREKSTQSVG